MKRRIVWLCLLVFCSVALERSSASQANSIAILGGTLIDGTGAPRRMADVRIVGDQIREVGKLKPLAGERVIDAKGMIVAPGFIDVHNHSERGFASDPNAKSQILQGITTLAVGPDGGSPFPISDYLAWMEKQRPAVNVMAFVGHATVRQRVMGDDFKRAATASEIAKMAELVEQAMREGAVGLSTGLEYDIGNPATTEEVITLSKVAARHGGIYMSHVRDEAEHQIKDKYRDGVADAHAVAIIAQDDTINKVPDDA